MSDNDVEQNTTSNEAAKAAKRDGSQQAGSSTGQRVAAGGSLGRKLDRLALPKRRAEEGSAQIRGTEAHAAGTHLRSAAAAQDTAAESITNALRRGIEGLMASSSRAKRSTGSAHRLPAGVRSEETPSGTLYRVRERHTFHHAHGTIPIGDALEVAPHTLAKLALDPSFESISLPKMLLIDTETTGLSKGAGTLAFLIGFGFFDDRGLQIEQLFLRRPGEEVPMLERLTACFEEASCIVSYNGKSFDWPLLRTRFVLNRVPVPKLPPHLDLLHCCRRLYRSTIGSMRLVTLERELLQMHRDGDLDGSLAPEIYLSYLRGSDVRGGRIPGSGMPGSGMAGSGMAGSGIPGSDEGLIEGVLHHNELDLLALAALLGKIGRDFEELRQDADPREQLAFARVALRSGDSAHADRFLESVVSSGEEQCALEAWWMRATQARRSGDRWTEEQCLHNALACAEGEESAAVHLALAKLYEHRRSDFARALKHARLARDAEEEAAHRRRVHRLDRKQDARSTSSTSRDLPS